MKTEIEEEWEVCIILFLVAIALFALAMNQQARINGLNADNERMKESLYQWEDFNRSFLPSTALPRL